MKRRWTRWIWILLFVGTTSLMFRVLMRDSSRDRRAETPPTSPFTRGLTGKDPQVFAAWQQLEQQRRQADETIWAPEIRAQHFQEFFVQLWDELRRTTNAWEVLGRHSATRMELPPNREQRFLDMGISEVRLDGDPTASRPFPLTEWLSRWQAEGWEVIQSEWRPRRYFEGSGQPPRSRLHISIHARRAVPPERLTIAAEVEVEWSPPSSSVASAGMSLPLPRRWRVLEAVIRARLEEQGMFVHEVAIPIEPERGLPYCDPLIVWDLDQNGYPEIILASKNQVHWNRDGKRFERGRLAPRLSSPPLAALIVDADGDGLVDLVGADAEGVWLIPGNRQGRFEVEPRRVWTPSEGLPNPFVLAPADVDGDGDIDLFLGQYKIPYLGGQMPTPFDDANDGFPSYLLLQQPDGTFIDETLAAGMEKHRSRRVYSATFADWNSDGRPDLSVVSDFGGLDAYRNVEGGRVEEVKRGNWGATTAFGMSQALGDFNGDLRMDLLMVGMNSYTGQRLAGLGLVEAGLGVAPERVGAMAYGNRLYLGTDGALAETPASRELAETGWSWGVTAMDDDLDGDLEIHIVNGHKSRGTVRDYEEQFWRHDVAVGTSDLNEARALYFQGVAGQLYGAGWSYGGFDKNRLLVGDGKGGFAEAGWLLGAAQEEDCRNLVGADLDLDGRMDWVATTYGNWPEGQQGLHVFRNELRSNRHWIGLHLRGAVRGRSVIGSQVTLVTARGSQRRWVLAGDSYRSQHPSTVHFGLGAETDVLRLEVLWPDGHRQVLRNPPVDAYSIAEGSSDSL